MPGLAHLPTDFDYLQAFQAIEIPIAVGRQPIFLGIAVGHVPLVMVTCLLGFRELQSRDLQVLLAFAALATLAAVQSTFAYNLPRNDRIQKLKLYSSARKKEDSFWTSERVYFEEPWNRWNLFRTVMLGFASACLAIVVLLAPPCW